MNDRRFDVVNDSLGFSVAIEDLPPEGLRISLTADAAKLSALAERLDVASIEQVTAAVELDWVKDEMGRRLVAVRGQIAAHLTQTCVVTLDPLQATLESEIDIRFTDRPDVAEPDLDSEPDDLDPPEYLPDGVIDVAEVVAQQLSLDINPFPRSPDLPYQDVSAGDTAEQEEVSRKPFAGLAALRDKLEK